MGNLKKISAILILLTIILAMSAVNAVYALGVTATVTVGNLPGAMAYDSAKGEIFVANEGVAAGTSTISVISDSNNTAVATIPVEAPFGVAYDSGKSEIFVTNTLFEHSLLNPTTNFISNTVSVISDSSNTSASPAPATSVSPTTVPEFSSMAFVSIVTLMIAVTLSSVVLAHKKSTQNRLIN
jgi:DNA-binding beta-propeller fold protein YncE